MAQSQITPYLITYFDQQDRAKRFTSPSFITREITSYYFRRQMRQVIDEAVKVEMLKQIQGQIKGLMKEAKALKGKKLREVGMKIERLAEQAKVLNG